MGGESSQWKSPSAWKIAGKTSENPALRCGKMSHTLETQQRLRQNDPPILKIFSGPNATRHQTILNQLWVTIDCIAHTQSCWILTPPKHTIWLSEWTKPKSLQSMEGHYEPYPMGACECGVYPMPQDIPHLPNFYNVDKFGRYNK